MGCVASNQVEEATTAQNHKRNSSALIITEENFEADNSKKFRSQMRSTVEN